MEKRYQVFVSSTYEDLQEERKEVMQALLELDCIPAGMELFPASNDDQWTLIKRVIDDCDYYLLIIGGRYGSTNEDGKSYTQMEFEYALEVGKPIISFLPKNPQMIPTGKCDIDAEKKEKLEKFKELTKKKMIKYWENPENLGSVVSRSMVKLIKDFPEEGWVKSNSAVDEVSLAEISRLQKENSELRERLQAIATEAPKGTERFAQGDDTISVGFTFQGVDKDTFDNYACTASLDLSWNELFTSIAPGMIDECTEIEMGQAIRSLIYSYRNTFLLNDPEFQSIDPDDISELKIKKEDFGRIKVQFRALGLICLSSKKRTRSTKDRNTYWTLTPYGDYIMTQLLAIKKE